MSLIRPLRATRSAGVDLEGAGDLALADRCRAGGDEIDDLLAARQPRARLAMRRQSARAGSSGFAAAGFCRRAGLLAWAWPRPLRRRPSWRRSWPPPSCRACAALLAAALPPAWRCAASCPWRAARRASCSAVVERHGLGIHRLRQRGEDPVMADIGAVAALEQPDRLAVRRMRAERRAAASAPRGAPCSARRAG